MQGHTINRMATHMHLCACSPYAPHCRVDCRGIDTRLVDSMASETAQQASHSRHEAVVIRASVLRTAARDEFEEVVVDVRTNTSRELSSCTCSALGTTEAELISAVKAENPQNDGHENGLSEPHLQLCQ